MSTVNTTLRFDLRQITSAPERGWIDLDRGSADARGLSVQFNIENPATGGRSIAAGSANDSNNPFLYTASRGLDANTTYNISVTVSSSEFSESRTSENVEINTADPKTYRNMAVWFALKNPGVGNALYPNAGIKLFLFNTLALRDAALGSTIAQVETAEAFTYKSESSTDIGKRGGTTTGKPTYTVNSLNPDRDGACFIQRVDINPTTNNYNYFPLALLEVGTDTYRWAPGTFDVGANNTSPFIISGDTKDLIYRVYDMNKVV